MIDSVSKNENIDFYVIRGLFGKNLSILNISRTGRVALM